jgi:beta-lactamase regulating signal transducer with metallopeptidase domain
MLVFLVENTVAAAALGLVVAAVCRFNRSRPALCHFLWLLVLVRLVMPPIPGLTLPTAALRDRAWQIAETTWARVAPGFLDGEGGRRSVSRRPLPPAPGDRASAQPLSPADSTGANPADGGEWARSERDPGLIFFAPADSNLGWTLPIGIWAIGALLVLGRESRRMIRVERLVRRSPRAPRELMRFVRRVGSRLGVRTPQVRLLSGLDSPFVWSLARPVLVWPMSNGVAKETRCRQGLVAHELAHLRRRDHWTAWVETAALLIHWWNPLVWFVRRRLRFHAEVACDEWAVETYPAERRSYAEALIDAAERMSFRLPSPLPALGAVDTDRREFEERLAVIFSRKEKATRRAPIQPAIAAVLVSALMLLSWTSAGGPEEARADEAASWEGIDPALTTAIRTAIRHARAERNLEAGEFAVAARLSEERLAENPDDARAWACAGRAALGLGRASEAAEAFARQIAQGYEVAEGEFQSALAHAKSGERGLAIGAVRRAVDRGFRDDKRLLKAPGLDSLREDQDSDEALAEAISRAKENASFSEEASCATFGPGETSPSETDPRNYHEFAKKLLRDGETDRALEALKRLVRLGWAMRDTLVDIACCHARRAEGEAALAYLHRAVDAGFMDAVRLWSDPFLSSLQGDPRLDRVVYRATDAATLARFKALDWAQLRRRSEERLKNAPDDGAELHRFGCAMLQIGDHDRAVEAFRRQFEAGYLKANAAYNIACCYALKREKGAAFQWLETAEAEGLVPGAMPLQAATILADPDLDLVRDDPRFKSLLDRL